MENLQELFEDTIKDLYNAEKQFLKAMPKLIKAAQDSKLKIAIQEHMTQTEGHISRLEEVAKLGGFKPTGKVCKAAQGLVEECQEHLDEGVPGATLDAAIICCAQKNEHYEITSYGTVVAWADTLGYSEISDLLEKTLGEENKADDLLTEVSKAVNISALRGDISTVKERVLPTKAAVSDAKAGSNSDNVNSPAKAVTSTSKVKTKTGSP